MAVCLDSSDLSLYCRPIRMLFEENKFIKLPISHASITEQCIENDN